MRTLILAIGLLIAGILPASVQADTYYLGEKESERDVRDETNGNGVVEKLPDLQGHVADIVVPGPGRSRLPPRSHLIDASGFGKSPSELGDDAPAQSPYIEVTKIGVIFAPVPRLLCRFHQGAEPLPLLGGQWAEAPLRCPTRLPVQEPP